MDETFEFLKRRCDEYERDYHAKASRVVSHARHLLSDVEDDGRRRLLVESLGDAERAWQTWSQAVTAMCQWRRSDQQSFEAVQ